MTAEMLFTEHQRWAASVASWVCRRIPSARTWTEDAKSEALMALWDRAQKYDELRGVKFRTWARRRVEGSVYDYLRKMRVIEKGNTPAGFNRGLLVAIDEADQNGPTFRLESHEKATIEMDRARKVREALKFARLDGDLRKAVNDCIFREVRNRASIRSSRKFKSAMSVLREERRMRAINA